MKSLLIVGCTILLVAVADIAAAKTPDEIQKIAHKSTVEIKLLQDDSVGSGVIIHQQGQVYTLVTNRHVTIHYLFLPMSYKAQAARQRRGFGRL
jgi:hypothetical protein